LPAPRDLAAAPRTWSLLISGEEDCEEKLLLFLVSRLGAQGALLSLKLVPCIRTSQHNVCRRLKAEDLTQILFSKDCLIARSPSLLLVRTELCSCSPTLKD